MAKRKIPVAVQLYSVREDCAKDLPGSLKQIAGMGYDGVEFAGYYGRSAGDLRKMLDDLGLKAAGAHVGIDTLLDGQIEASIAFHKAIGNRFLIVPGLPESYRNSIDAWKRTAALFNRIADRLAPQGMYTGYHNHHTEFALVDGVMPWQVLLENTGPRVVIQADTGNALHGGQDVVPWLERFPGRALSVHLKEYSPRDDKAVIGEGDVNWKKLFQVCETTGKTEWYVVEQESYRAAPLECVRLCRQNLKKMGK